MLKVTELGKEKFNWWPDWEGCDAAIIASGPSVKGIDLNQIRGRCKVIAIKKTFELCEWADAVFGCDAPWWRSVNGLKQFNGLKFCFSGSDLHGHPEIIRVNIDKEAEVLLLDKPAHLGSGGNSAFQALNLIVQFGAKRILLVGVDMTDRPGAHWYGRNNWLNASNPGYDSFSRWNRSFLKIRPQLDDLGIEVINSSPYGACKAFKSWSVPDTLKAWSA